MRSQSEDSPQFAWFSWATNTMTVSTNAAGARELDSAKVPTDVHTYIRMQYVNQVACSMNIRKMGNQTDQSNAALY